MKLQPIGATALAASAVAPVAPEDDGATGVVPGRLNGMTAMRDAVAELAPMMQGAFPSDAFIVPESAGIIAGHAGGTTQSLSPEDSLERILPTRSQGHLRRSRSGSAFNGCTDDRNGSLKNGDGQ